VMVCIGVLVLRHTRPDLPRPFRLRWPWFTCTMGVLFCGAMMGFLDAGTWLRLVIWAIVGVTIYYFYGRHHSRLHQSKPTSATGA
jgi:basic amino acid/polyamine antiporter, APA family